MNARKNFASYVLCVMLTLVSVISFTGCGKTEADEFSTTSENVTPKPKPTPDPVSPGMKPWLHRDSTNNGHEYSFEITSGDSISGVQYRSTGFASMDENDRYVIEERYRNLNVSYANAHRTFGAPETAMRNGVLVVNSLATFGLEDGNVVKVNSTVNHATGKINGKTVYMPCDSLVNVRIVSLNNVDAAATRAQYISDSVRTAIVAELTYRTVGLTNNYSYTQNIADTITRYLLSDDAVDSVWYENKYRKVLTSSTEECGFTKVVRMKSGEESRLQKSVILNYGVTPIAEYEKRVSNFDYRFVNSNGVSKGTPSFNRSEEYWRINREVDNYSANISNDVEPVQTSYTLFHESTVYDDGQVTVDFPMLEMTVAENGTKVTPIESTKGTGYDMARLDNAIELNYQGYKQASAEDVILWKQGLYVVAEGWDEASKWKTITATDYNCGADYVVKYSDGTEKRDSYKISKSWSVRPVSHWSVVANNISFSKGNLVAKVNGTSKSEKDGEATWNWTENVHTINAVISVANGNQNDEWTATTVNNFSITRNGNTLEFGNDDYQLTDGKASVTSEPVSSTETEDVYSYTHSISFGYVNHTQEASVPGTIIIKKEIHFDFDMTITGVQQLVVRNEDHTSWCYSWLISFANGQVLPVKVEKNGAKPQFNMDWLATVGGKRNSSELNGAVYQRSTGKWVPCYGFDSADCLQYESEDGYNADNIGYPAARKLGWDEGHTDPKYHDASVHTNRFQFTIENGTFSVVDTYSGQNVGSWTYKQ